MKAVIDNDVLYKGACYGLLWELVSVICYEANELGILGVSRFIVSKIIQRRPPNKGSDTALNSFAAFLCRAKVFEPTDEEQQMAADFELAAQRVGVALDGGESLLCAVIVCRTLPLFLTGDKRAITAVEELLDLDARLQHLTGKIKCLEQLTLCLLGDGDGYSIKAAVCAEPQVDKALTICFSCTNPNATAGSFREGLKSYIDSLRANAGRVLAN